MPKYVWVGPSNKVSLMYLCIALIAALVFIDGLMKGEMLRALAGGIVAGCFGTFMFRGIPLPERLVHRAEADLGNAMSMRPGATSPSFRWAMVALSGLIGVGAILVAFIMLAGSPETLESFMPRVARAIRSVQGSDAEMIERLGYAALFLVAGAAALFTAWKRAKG